MPILLTQKGVSAIVLASKEMMAFDALAGDPFFAFSICIAGFGSASHILLTWSAWGKNGNSIREQCIP